MHPTTSQKIIMSMSSTSLSNIPNTILVCCSGLNLQMAFLHMQAVNQKPISL